LSVKFASLYPETTSPAAAEGTRQHAIAAQHLLEGTLSADPRMQTYLDAVWVYEGHLMVEQKLTIIEDVCWGTADAAILHSNSFTLLDLKWGKQPVSPINNPQLMLYGLGILREYPHPESATVELVIIQPNGSSGWPVKTWHTEVKTLLQFQEKVLRAIDRADRENPPAVPGAHCFYCPAKMHCQEYLYSVGMKKQLTKG
jgi:hypothetical protein